jgi:hypothetical protein
MAKQQEATKRTNVHEVTHEVAKGKTEVFAVTGAIWSVLAEGMRTAVKLINHWQVNAQKIVAEFWPGYEPVISDNVRSIQKALRGDDDESRKPFGRLVSSLTQASPDWDAAQRQIAKMKALPAEGEEYDAVKMARDKYLENARNVAGKQARAILEHYAKQMKGEEAAAAERFDPTAEELIRQAEEDWTNRLQRQRGNMELQAERDNLRMGVDALREVLKAITAKRGKLGRVGVEPETRTFAADEDLTVAGKRTVGKEGKKAGAVTVKKGEEVEETEAAE